MIETPVPGPMPPIVLASTSRYRRALMDRLGLPYEALAPGCDEAVGGLRDPVAIVRRLARRKARAAAARRPGAVVIGSDQVLALGDDILHKPGSAARAREQLARLSGRTHRLVTGLAVIDGRDGGEEVLTHVELRITVRALTAAEIARYVALDDPLDCAGSYKLESLGPWLVEGIEGEDETAIVGLPLLRLTGVLRGLGISALGPPAGSGAT